MTTIAHSGETLLSVLERYAAARSISIITKSNYECMLRRARVGCMTVTEMSDEFLVEKKALLKEREVQSGRSGIWAEKSINTILMLRNFAAPGVEPAPRQRFVDRTPVDSPQSVFPAVVYDVDSTALTIGDFWKRYHDEYLKLYTRSTRDFSSIYRLYLQPWEAVPLEAIRRRDVIALQNFVARKRGPLVGTKVVELLCMIFNKAIEFDVFEGQNPTRMVRRYKAESRERFLQSDEFARFFEAVSKLKNQVTRDFFLMLLFTAQRKRNVCEMKWSEIDFDRAVWRIPRTKNGKSHTVPLVGPAFDILNARRARPDAHPVWVFPRTDGQGPILYRCTAWKRVITAAKLENLRIHDLRRSMASWQAITGSNISVIAGTLAHRDLKSTQIYARLNDAAIRESMEIATAKILENAGAT